MTADTSWVLFLPQLPSSPSSLRVLVWRRLRSAGALGLQNGVWVFPRAPEHERFLRDLQAEIEPQGGGGLLLAATPVDPEENAQIIERFRADRDQEYAEFLGRGRDFLAEIDQETARQNFTFAELEENEQDLHKLDTWLRKIMTRDFFGGYQQAKALEMLEHCRSAFESFAGAIYALEGLEPGDGEPGCD